MKHLSSPVQWIARRMLPVLMILIALAYFTVPTAQAAALHPTIPTMAQTCTPNNYHHVNDIGIYNVGDGNLIGWLDVYADGCGWVYASVQAETSYESAVVNHVEIYRSSDNSLVTAAAYNGGSYNRTNNVNVGSTLVYAKGVVQVPAFAMWGQSFSGNFNGYSPAI